MVKINDEMGNVSERRHLPRLDVDGRAILQWMGVNWID